MVEAWREGNAMDLEDAVRYALNTKESIRDHPGQSREP